jgi:hypothetical protein
MSQKTIKIPHNVARLLSEKAHQMAQGPAKSIASSLVGVAVVAIVFAVTALALMLLVAGGLISARWLWTPVVSSVALAVVTSGVALDVLRELRGPTGKER